MVWVIAVVGCGWQEACMVGSLEAEAYVAACICVVWAEGGVHEQGPEAEVVSGRVCVVCATEGVGGK